MVMRASTRPRAEPSEPSRARKGNDDRRRGNANPSLGMPRAPESGPCRSCSTRKRRLWTDCPFVAQAGTIDLLLLPSRREVEQECKLEPVRLVIDLIVRETSS